MMGQGIAIGGYFGDGALKEGKAMLGEDFSKSSPFNTAYFLGKAVTVLKFVPSTFLNVASKASLTSLGLWAPLL